MITRLTGPQNAASDVKGEVYGLGRYVPVLYALYESKAIFTTGGVFFEYSPITFDACGIPFPKLWKRSLP